MINMCQALGYMIRKFLRIRYIYNESMHELEYETVLIVIKTHDVLLFMSIDDSGQDVNTSMIFDEMRGNRELSLVKNE